MLSFGRKKARAVRAAVNMVCAAGQRLADHYLRPFSVSCSPGTAPGGVARHLPLSGPAAVGRLRGDCWIAIGWRLLMMVGGAYLHAVEAASHRWYYCFGSGLHHQEKERYLPW